jgi:hypothetical protein
LTSCFQSKDATAPSSLTPITQGKHQEPNLSAFDDEDVIMMNNTSGDENYKYDEGLDYAMDDNETGSLDDG